MYPTVHRARTTMVDPWAASALGDPKVRPPRSVLLYGPHGCGVTFIAHRLVDELAAAADVPAVVVDVFDATFAGETLSGVEPDELSLVDVTLDSPALRDLVLIGVSHAPWDLRAPGRRDLGFERMVFVPPPDWDARRFRIWESPWGPTMNPADLDRLVVATEMWSGVDLRAALETWSNTSPRASAADDDTAAPKQPPIDMLLAAVASTRPSTLAWLRAAGALVRELGPNGQLDDLAGYLQRYRLL